MALLYNDGVYVIDADEWYNTKHLGAELFNYTPLYERIDYSKYKPCYSEGGKTTPAMNVQNIKNSDQMVVNDMAQEMLNQAPIETSKEVAANNKPQTISQVKNAQKLKVGNQAGTGKSEPGIPKKYRSIYLGPHKADGVHDVAHRLRKQAGLPYPGTFY